MLSCRSVLSRSEVTKGRPVSGLDLAFPMLDRNWRTIVGRRGINRCPCPRGQDEAASLIGTATRSDERACTRHVKMIGYDEYFAVAR